MSLYQEGFTQNREISWLRYNERVLEEALDSSVPLFERLKYINIFETNLEEFFRVRVGSLIAAEKDDDEIDEKSGLSARSQLDEIDSIVRPLIKKKDEIYIDLEKKLSDKGVKRIDYSDLTQNELFEIDRYFREDIKPNLRVKILRNEFDFNDIDENKIYVITELLIDGNLQYGIVEIPSEINQIVVYRDEYNFKIIKFILLEDIIKHYISSIFFPYHSSGVYTIRIARNAEIELGESDDMLSEMKEVVKKRKVSAIDKLIIDGEPSKSLHSFLLRNMYLDEKQIYISHRISLSFLSELEEVIPNETRASLFFKEYEPFNQLSLGHGTILDRVRKEDILSHYPYDSMEPFLQLLRESSESREVSEIRITIYRLSSHPEIVEHLINAANNGKTVNVLIELRARFDEENNIDWAEKLKASGCNVYYGSNKYKVHSKICQIVMNPENPKYITQLSTGNYNEKTAKLYTDFSLITYDQRIGLPVNEFWNDLINKENGKYDNILTSPKSMKKEILRLIDRETKKGSEGRIFIKVNSLSDEEIIESLMYASCSGCKIRMIVRGICCLLPGVEYCTENIEIVNVVGRFLEHSRVYIFGQGEDEAVYLSSSDLMSRNMNKRFELAFPIYNKKLKQRIKAIMYLNFFDNKKGRKLNSKGEYVEKGFALSSKQIIDSQKLLMVDNK